MQIQYCITDLDYISTRPEPYCLCLIRIEGKFFSRPDKGVIESTRAALTSGKPDTTFTTNTRSPSTSLYLSRYHYYPEQRHGFRRLVNHPASRSRRHPAPLIYSVTESQGLDNCITSQHSPLAMQSTQQLEYLQKARASQRDLAEEMELVAAAESQNDAAEDTLCEAETPAVECAPTPTHGFTPINRSSPTIPFSSNLPPSPPSSPHNLHEPRHPSEPSSPDLINNLTLDEIFTSENPSLITSHLLFELSKRYTFSTICTRFNAGKKQRQRQQKQHPDQGFLTQSTLSRRLAAYKKEIIAKSGCCAWHFNWELNVARRQNGHVKGVGVPRGEGMCGRCVACLKRRGEDENEDDNMHGHGYKNHSEDLPPQEYWPGPGRANSPFAIVKGKRALNHQ